MRHKYFILTLVLIFVILCCAAGMIIATAGVDFVLGALIVFFGITLVAAFDNIRYERG